MIGNWILYNFYVKQFYLIYVFLLYFTHLCIIEFKETKYLHFPQKQLVYLKIW